MTAINKIKYFKIQSNLNISLPKEVNVGFDNGVNMFYTLPQTNFVSSDVLEDDEADLAEELELSIIKMEKITNLLLEKGFELINLEEYKEAEKNIRESQKSNFLNNLTNEEKLVHTKTREFLEDNDISIPAQRQFIVSLRTFIVNGDNINEAYLVEHAKKLNKDLKKFIDPDLQSMICDFAAMAQTEIKEIKEELNTTKKRKTKKVKA